MRPRLNRSTKLSLAHLDGANVVFRVVGKDAGEFNTDASEVAEPTLEEAYLAFMAKRGKLEQADQTETVAEHPKKKRRRKDKVA